MIDILVNNEIGFPLDETSLKELVGLILADHGFQQGEVSLAIVSDPTIHALNRRHLQHDYPTDVLSFVLEMTEDRLEGEVIVSGETASRLAASYGWSAEAELMLYLVHGCLHLVGFDDQSEPDRESMRRQEMRYLGSAGMLAEGEPCASHDQHYQVHPRAEESSA